MSFKAFNKGDQMIKKSVPLILFFWLGLTCAGAEIESLSALFCLGKGILDQDNDGHADKVAICIVVPDHPSVFESAAAADIAARANFESLVVDFTLVKKESDYKNLTDRLYPLFIGSNLEKVKGWAEKEKVRPGKDQGLVSLLGKDTPGLVLMADSGETLLRTARAFFLRWPYLWEIWGREEGETYSGLEEDLKEFFETENLSFSQIAVSSASYAFPVIKSPHEALQKLRFDRGEIAELEVAVEFDTPREQGRAGKALENLRDFHRRGLRTDCLSYSGCSQVTFELRCGERTSRVSISRMGYPKRMLTPSYKAPSRPARKGKEFDLLQLFTTRGFYADSDNDSIPDTLESLVILPKNASSCWGTSWLTSRLVLETAGAAFPIVQIDQDIENEESFQAPIIVGKENRFFQDLVRTGKMKDSRLESGWGKVEVVAQALNKSSALAVWGEDEKGLEKTLSFLGRTFPYFDEYGEGHPSFHDIPTGLQEFLEGKHGSAEAYVWNKLTTYVEGLKDKKLEHFNLKLYLPENRPEFTRHIHQYLNKAVDSDKIAVQDFALRDSRTIFSKEKEFPWEGDEAFDLVQERLNDLRPSSSSLFISVGVSESPEVRKVLEEKISALLLSRHFARSEVEVHSAYKQGFFWIEEKVLPSLKEKGVHRLRIRFAREAEDLSQPKRFYSEPYRWLQELYPVDEIIAEEIGIPLDRVEFEMKEEKEPVYDLLAFDEKNRLLLEEHFSPHTREALYMNLLPEWGKVRLTTGWVKIMRDNEVLLDTILETDLERFWKDYQEETLPDVYSYILKNTAGKPTFKKQPFFKRLLIEMWLSEPDYRLGLDEEMVSSLESMHDEIYFDTLDFLRGITEQETGEREDFEDTPRYSAPGNILPMIYPSSEGKKGKVRITFEGWQARSPQMVIDWKEEGRRDRNERFVFPEIKAKTLRLPSFIYNGSEERVENILAELEIEKEKDYLLLLEIIGSLRELQDLGILLTPFRYPRLKSLTVRTRHKDWEKEETFTIQFPAGKVEAGPKEGGLADVSIPTDEIISPGMCLDLVERLAHPGAIRSYIAGRSYEGREIPVLEVFTPLEKYVSIPRLITLKPSLYLSGRQHANEVSSTNYILKFAELLARDPDYRDFTRKMNFILHPMENPDGAELAYELQKLTPNHSLHAGRYTSLGIDVGYQVGASRPFLSEARVRKALYERWRPDIYLNLHGYPSHEWVQQFSNYSPFLFRDFWIPRGWYALYRSLSLPVYEKWKRAGEQLQEFIVREITENQEFLDSSKKFHDRYDRWASRWQPHMDYMEIREDVNLYAKRRSSQETKISDRSRTTFVEETPELMDETAQGKWLDFLCMQGLTYLRAHAKYLARAGFKTARIEEESQGRVKIQIVRARPGKVE
jgi:hypothetical protein